MLKETYHPIVEMQFGSHVYGTNLPTSDLDFKAVHLPDAEDILLGQVVRVLNTTTKVDKTAKNTVDDVDNESFSVLQYLTLLMEGHTVALDMLFTPRKFYLTAPAPAWEFILENKSRFLHSGCASFVGYCREQANKYGLKGGRVNCAALAADFFRELVDKDPYVRIHEVFDDIKKVLVQPANEHIALVESPPKDGKTETLLEVCNRKVPLTATVKMAHEIFNRLHDKYGERARQAATNQNVDRKAIMHAVRVCEEAKELLSTGNITFPRPEAPLLLKIRTGELAYKDVEPMIEQGLIDVENYAQKSILPKEPDEAFAKELVKHMYSAVVDFDFRTRDWGEVGQKFNALMQRLGKEARKNGAT